MISWPVNAASMKMYSATNPSPMLPSGHPVGSHHNVAESSAVAVNRVRFGAFPFLLPQCIPGRRATTPRRQCHEEVPHRRPARPPARAASRGAGPRLRPRRPHRAPFRPSRRPHRPPPGRQGRAHRPRLDREGRTRSSIASTPAPHAPTLPATNIAPTGCGTRAIAPSSASTARVTASSTGWTRAAIASTPASTARASVRTALGPSPRMSSAMAQPLDARIGACEPQTLEDFLASVSARAFRFAELALRHRDDALDAVQDAMVKMLRLRDASGGRMDAAVLERAAQPDHRPAAAPHVPSASGSCRRHPRRTGRWTGRIRGRIRRAPMIQREAYAHLATALQALPARQREAFTLRVLEELDVATTARVMGCSEGSVKTHLSRARDALAEATGGFPMTPHDLPDTLDAQARALHVQSLDRLSPRVQAQLAQRRRAALQGTPRRGRRGGCCRGPGWPRPASRSPSCCSFGPLRRQRRAPAPRPSFPWVALRHRASRRWMRRRARRCRAIRTPPPPTSPKIPSSTSGWAPRAPPPRSNP